MKLSNDDEFVSETTFSDMSTSSFDNTSDETPSAFGTLGNFFRRSSLRSSGKKKKNDKEPESISKVKKMTKPGEACKTH